VAAEHGASHHHTRPAHASCAAPFIPGKHPSVLADQPTHHHLPYIALDFPSPACPAADLFSLSNELCRDAHIVAYWDANNADKTYPLAELQLFPEYELAGQ